jgi:uncharacterized phiE125 gp8 family phage protein
MALEVITDPNIEPVSVEDLKTYMRLDGDDFDDLLSSLITAGREEAEEYQNRAYDDQTLAEWFDKWPNLPHGLPRAPLQAINAVKYYDTDDNEYTLDASIYFVDTKSEPGRINLVYGESLPSIVLRPTNAVYIEYACGYGAANVPDRTKTAIMLFAKHRFENPDSDTVPDAFYNLLNSNRLGWF